jgi:hypothetical protein
MTRTFSDDVLGGHVVGGAFSSIAHPRVLMASDCSAAPIDGCLTAGNAPGMNRHRTPLADDAAALLVAAERLQPDPGEPASIEVLTSSLAEVEEALRALSDATKLAADALIPPASIGEGASRRYARAAATWPRHGGGAPPSYERQAQILTALHDAGATLRAGAECCRRARAILASTIA